MLTTILSLTLAAAPQNSLKDKVTGLAEILELCGDLEDITAGKKSGKIYAVKRGHILITYSDFNSSPVKDGSDEIVGENDEFSFRLEENGRLYRLRIRDGFAIPEEGATTEMLNTYLRIVDQLNRFLERYCPERDSPNSEDETRYA